MVQAFFQTISEFVRVLGTYYLDMVQYSAKLFGKWVFKPPQENQFKYVCLNQPKTFLYTRENGFYALKFLDFDQDRRFGINKQILNFFCPIVLRALELNKNFNV